MAERGKKFHHSMKLYTILHSHTQWQPMVQPRSVSHVRVRLAKG